MVRFNSLAIRQFYQYEHNAKLAIHENNGLTIGEQKNPIQNFYNPLLTEFRDMQLLFYQTLKIHGFLRCGQLIPTTPFSMNLKPAIICWRCGGFSIVSPGKTLRPVIHLHRQNQRHRLPHHEEWTAGQPLRQSQELHYQGKVISTRHAGGKVVSRCYTSGDSCGLRFPPGGDRGEDPGVNHITL